MLISILVALIASEFALRTFTPLPVTQQSNRVPDDALLYRLDQRLRDVDARGFRNPDALDSYDVVAIGDSHTYGYNVTWRQAWPHQLGVRTGKRVYNMGVGGYGVYQYAHLFNLALQYKPSHVIIGLYPANDLEGSCALLHLPHWQDVINREDLETPPCKLPLAPSVAENPPSVGRRLYGFASEHAALINLIEREYSTRLTPASAYLIERDGHELPVRQGSVANHFQSTSLNVDMTATNFRNSLHLFRVLAAAADPALNIGVLIIPSKERVFASWAERGGGNVPAPVKQAVDSERNLTDKYREFFEGLGIGVADATATMVRQVEEDVASGRKTYPANDGHPLPPGYSVYAAVANELIMRGRAPDKGR
jgi:hypothetical protein